jgi:hypothetical protein
MAKNRQTQTLKLAGGSAYLLPRQRYRLMHRRVLFVLGSEQLPNGCHLQKVHRTPGMAPSKLPTGLGNLAKSLSLDYERVRRAVAEHLVKTRQRPVCARPITAE